MVLSMDRWVGKVAVVTGASSGIGEATVEALVGKGLKVAGVARRKERMDELMKKLSNKSFFPVKADMRKEEDIIQAFVWVKTNLGPIHILINNAGRCMETGIADGDSENWRTVLDVNVLGLAIATREALKDMRANKIDGHIIHINSVTGHQVYDVPNLHLYTASKFAVTALAESLRLELMRMKSKIKITSISPGPVDTEIFPESIKIKIADSFIESENIADAVVYALSTPPHVQIQELTVRAVDESFLKELS